MRHTGPCEVALALFCLTGSAALAHDGANDQWYEGLTVPGTNGASCCQKTDCKTVKARIRKDGLWEAWIDEQNFPNSKTDPKQGHAPNAWIIVADAAVMHQHNNPMGEAVACYYDAHIICFIEPVQV